MATLFTGFLLDDTVSRCNEEMDAYYKHKTIFVFGSVSLAE